MNKANGLFMAARKNSRMIQTGVTIFSFMNISMATMVQDLEPVTRQAGPELLQKLSSFLECWMQKMHLKEENKSAFIQQ